METLDQFLLKNGNETIQKSVLLIVCNTKMDTQKSQDYEDFSIDTEFLSNDELQEITEMAIQQKIPFRIFYDEKDFIRNIASLSNAKLKNIIVYNSAQNGIGPGRKALIPSICKYFSLRFTGSDAYRVCLCRDKFAVNCILKSYGVPVPFSVLYNDQDNPLPDDSRTYIAKPIYESSSIGITRNNIFQCANFPREYLHKLMQNLQQPLILQEFINGYELEVPVLVGKNSTFVFDPVVLHYNKDNLMMGREILDYTRIYKDDYYFSSLPSNMSTLKLKQTAKAVANFLGLRGLCRVDFRMLNADEFFVTDVSTNPHFIKHSSVNYAFKAINKQDSDILRTMLLLS